jgi:hypothetical protein
VSYTPPDGNKVAIKFGNPPFTGTGNLVPIPFADPNQTILPAGWEGLAFGNTTVAISTARFITNVTLGDLLTVGVPSVRGSAQTIFPDSFANLLFGTASVKNFWTFARPSGFVATLFGITHLANGTPQLFPTGIPPGTFGTAKVVNFIGNVRPTGFDASVFGTQWVSLYVRRLTNVTLNDQSLFGTAALSGGVRTLDLSNRGIAPGSAGTPVVTFSIRTIFPQGLFAGFFGTPLVDRTHTVLPSGFGGEQFGAAQVFYPRFIVDLAGLGINAGAFGTTDVELHIKYIAPVGFLAIGHDEIDRFGRHVVFNLTQYIQQIFSVTPSDGGVFGDFNLVDLKDKFPRPDGIQPGRVGTPTVFNNARIITTPPFQDFSLWGNTLVAPAIRFITPAGTDMIGWGSPLGNIVYNAARVLAPQGFNAGAVGVPVRVFSNQQTVKVVGGDQSSFGQAMVAFAIRTIAPPSLPPQPPFGNADVELFQRFVAPPSIPPAGLGVPTLEIHFTIIAAKSVLPPSNQVGIDTRVHNNTPEIGQQGATMTLYGNANVFNQFEVYEFQGFESILWGRPLVKDRKQTVSVPGWTSYQTTGNTQVQNVNPSPPGQQYINPSGFDQSVFGATKVFANTLYPLGWNSAIYGTPAMELRGLGPVGIPPPYNDSGTQFGTALLNRPPVLTPTGIIEDAYGTPSIGPMYIWAPHGYPYTTGLQTELGYPIDRFSHADEWGDNTQDDRPIFGRAEVTLKNRVINPIGFANNQMGQDHSVVLRLQYINNTGIKSFKYGIPVINYGGVVQTTGFDMSAFGLPAVFIPVGGNNTIAPRGIAAFVSGPQDVQNFNRPIFPAGWVEFRVSTPVPPSWPRASTWVSNAYPPFPAVGFDASSFGTAWVSFRVRELDMQGFDSAVVAAYTPGQFADRMRVTKNVGISGITVGSTGAMGVPTITTWQRSLLPGGFAAGAIGKPAVRTANRVNVSGWESLVFGDVQRWEAGKVKPHGDEFVLWGNPRFNRVILTQGWEGDMGTPSLAPRYDAIGFDASSYGVPTLTATVCGQRAMAVPGFNAGAVGVPGVSA